MRRFLPAAVLVVLLSAPAGAGAQKCIARPGTAALDQYCETVPTDKGDAPARPSDGRLRSALPPETVSKLERHGDEGKAVLALPVDEDGAPPSSGQPASGTKPLPSGSAAPPRDETDAPPDAPSGSPITAAFGALGGVGALGWGVVLVLLALAVVAAASAVATRATATRE